MAKAARILAALKRDGWIETRRSGSHPVLVKGDQQRVWAYHDDVDLGGPAISRIARATAIRSTSCGNCRVIGMSTLRVELFWDEEASNWHYRVPALHINGGGTATREQAERESLSAVAFALEGDPRDYDPSAEAVTLDVSVALAA
jgi:predicted RNA binding protein YcfA (HicA-like mRNA interferase family)